MSKEVIKEVGKLNEHEIYLLLHDESIQDDIYQYVYQMKLYYMENVFEHIEPYISEYNIVPYDNNYIEVDDNVGFIKGANELYKIHGLINSNEAIKALETANEVLNKIDNCKVFSNEYFDLISSIEDCVSIISNHIVDRFIEYLDYYDSIDKIQRDTDYIEDYLDIISDIECLIDNDSVTLI